MRQSPEQVRFVCSRPSLARGLAQAFVVAALIGCGGGDGITVSNNVASLRFVLQPGTVQINQPFTVSVELLNSGGERIASATTVVTISATGATLSGATSVAAVAGLATFPSLSITSAGTNVQIQATAAGRSVTSAAFAATDPCGPVTLTVPGNTSGTISDASCLIGSNRSAVYSFVAPATGAATFSTNAAFSARAEVTTNPAGTNITFINSQGSTVTAEWLLPAGTYLFRVGARSGAGAYSVTSTSTTGTGGCNLRAFVVGGAFLQNLAADDCTDAIGAFVDIFAIYSTSSCTITLSSGAIDTYLTVLDPIAGDVIIEDDDSGGGTNSQVTLASCGVSGNPLALLASSFSVGEVGAYTITIQLGGSEPAPDVLTDAPLATPVPMSAEVLSKLPIPSRRSKN